MVKTKILNVVTACVCAPACVCACVCVTQKEKKEEKLAHLSKLRRRKKTSGSIKPVFSSYFIFGSHSTVNHLICAPGNKIFLPVPSILFLSSWLAKSGWCWDSPLWAQCISFDHSETPTYSNSLSPSLCTASLTRSTGTTTPRNDLGAGRTMALNARAPRWHKANIKVITDINVWERKRTSNQRKIKILTDCFLS